jgi:hypothetical protein
MEFNNSLLETIIKPYEQKIAELKEQIEQLKKEQRPGYMSADIKELATSLAKAQGEIGVAALNRQNPYFKSRYADLMAIVQAARPALAKNGLSVVQDIITHDDGQSVLHTLLLHNSGQYIESRMRIVPPKNDIQTISSYATYLKRLTYASLIGVVTGEEDDDAEQAVATERDTFAKGVALNTKYNPREQSPEVITKEQLEELEYELNEYPDIGEMVLDGLKIQSLADMPKSKYMVSLTRIREIKGLRNGMK